MLSKKKNQTSFESSKYFMFKVESSAVIIRNVTINFKNTIKFMRFGY